MNRQADAAGPTSLFPDRTGEKGDGPRSCRSGSQPVPQGDQRVRVTAELEKLGYKVKRVGG